MSDDRSMSLAERMRARKAAQQAAEEADKPMSMAERMRARKTELAAEAKEAADDAGMSLAEKMRARKTAEADDESGESLSLAERMRQKKEQQNDEAGMSLAEKMRARQQTAKEKLTALDDDDISGDALDEDTASDVEAKIDDIKETFSDLAGRVELTDLIADFTEISNDIEAFPSEIAEIRRKGYIYRAYLEEKVEVFAVQWDNIDRELNDWIDDTADELDDELDQIKTQVERLDISEGINSGHQALAEKVEDLLSTLEEQVITAEEHVRDMYDELEREVSRTKSELSEIKTFIQEAEAASFDFQPGESVYLVAQAEWDDGRDKPDGNIFVTSQRLVFEQKEKTGKRLGMFGGKHTQEALWEAPMDTLEQVESDKKGMFGGKDIIHFTFGSGAPYGQISIEIKGGLNAHRWAAEVRKASKGLIGNESTVEEDPDLIERLQNAPTECNTCGATLPQISASVNSITCDYCGTTVRI